MNLTELCQKADRAIVQRRVRGLGSDGIVYDLDDKVVLKLVNGAYDRHYRKGNSQMAAEYEYGIGRDLFDHQVQVPEFYGLYQHRGPLRCYLLCLWNDYFFSEEEPHWGIIMQRIKGSDVPLSNSNKVKEAERQLAEQLQLACALGYKPNDVFLNQNTLFDCSQNKLYLIDFTRWEKK